MLMRPHRRIKRSELKALLDEKADFYNRPSFIENDPISIPHQFTLRQDIEIAGFFAAVLAWGKRITIIRKCNELMDRMDRSPYAFVTGHKYSDLKRLAGDQRRTYNDSDSLLFVAFMKW